ncbi:hypothetical protein [Xanthomonas arboricola]|uniref:hypothetical protein n=1 Tax=Xanthomonas arboricola TaxID=56448 RepID=UPI000F8E9B01|nr:hypothetical protein [Xanthomonas arboricola]
MTFFKIRIPLGSKKSRKHVPVVIVKIDEEDNEIVGSEENAIMRPDDSVGPGCFPTLKLRQMSASASITLSRTES